ncbi:MAG: exopolysaccharide biosynthesis protein [Aestuariivirga sp.]|nr:exopolysaccharide biosynthesis protein [Aestuariivirga sp.]
MQEEEPPYPKRAGSDNPKPKPSRLSEIVKSIDTSEDVTIGALVDSLGERAFGALMFIFAVPNIIPTPPGTSAILGLPLIILTWQLMIGRQSLWLPEAIRKRRISREVLGSFVSKMTPIMSKIERVLKPRFGLVVSSDLAERMIGLVTFALSLVLFLPIPLNNMLPAAAISCIALGLAERDGVAVVVGYLLGAASVAVLALISSALYIGVMAFFRALFGM